MSGSASRPFVLIAGGGTAGHVLPGLAVAAELRERGHAASDIVFVGAERGLEATLVPDAGYEITLLPGRGIQRRLTLENLAAAFGLVRALRSAEVTEKFKSYGIVPVPSTAAQFDAFLQSESLRYTKVVKEAGIKAE